MKLYNVLFSATGRTEKVADMFCRQLGETNTKIDLSDQALECLGYNFTAEDVCVVSVPVYEGRVPKPAAEKLAQFKGNGAKAVLVAVFGNRAVDDCLLEMQDILTASGFTCIAGVEAVAEHSIMPQFGAGRPDADDEAQLKAFAAEIKECLNSKSEFEALDLPGNRPYVEMGGISIKPSADKKCMSCGLCVKKCPVDAIPADNPKMTDKDKCINCMRCTEICPTHARKLSPVFLKVASVAMRKKLSGHKENKLYIAKKTVILIF